MTYREPLKMDNVIRAVVAQTGESQRTVELEAVFVKEMNAEGTRAVAAYMQTMGVANAKPV